MTNTANNALLDKFQQLQQHIEQQIIGQPQLVERMLLVLLANGHILVEGPPGLAKTKAIKTLAESIEGSFHRIQFTPDLLPSDITGTDIYRPETGTFEFQSGPIFHNLLLADEINRAPAKVQAALLEAMAEGQVSIGKRSLPMDPLFMVMATQNPLEQEGTYPLPEAQLDRFMLHVKVDYPDAENEKIILELVENEARDSHQKTNASLSQEDLFAARQAILNLHVSDTIKDYMVQLIIATRQPENYDAELANLIAVGVSPRATIALSACAKANAWLKGQAFVTPDNVQAVIHDVLRHRLILNFEADAQGIDADQITDRILQFVPVT